MFEELMKSLVASVPGVNVAEPVKRIYDSVTADPESDAPETYDTPLTPDEETKFQAWKQQYAPLDTGEDYDLRGAFKAGLTPDPASGHWPDTFKKPNHPTFSDESMYAKGKEAPKAGHWEGDQFVPPDPVEQADASLYKSTDDGSLDFLERSPLETSSVLRAPMEQLEAVLNPEGEAAFRSKVKPIRLYSDEELLQTLSNPADPNYANARNEQAMRKRWAGQSVIDNLSDPDFVARHAKDLADQFVASVPRITGDIPTLAGTVAAIPAIAGSDIGAETSKDLLETGAEYYAKVNDIVQTHEPQNTLENLASIIPSAAIPIGGEAKLGGGLIRNIAEVATPFTIGGGGGRIAANVGAQFGVSEIVRNAMKTEQDNYESVFSSFFSPSDVEAAGSDPTLDFKIGQTTDGADIRNSDLAKVGWFGAATIGMMVAPRIAKYFRGPIKNLAVELDPTGREYPAGLEGNVRATDLYRIALSDPNAPMFDSLKRWGLNVDTMQHEIETHSSATQQRKIGVGIEDGYISTYDGKYKSPVRVNRLLHYYDSLDDVKKAQADDYANMHDLIDRMKKLKVNSLFGVTLKDAEDKLKMLDRSSPIARIMHEGFRKTNAALLDFLSDGKYGTLTKSFATDAKKDWAGFYSRVPEYQYYGDLINSRPKNMFTHNPRLNGRNEPHVSAYVGLRDWTEAMMRNKIINANRGTIIDALKNSTNGKRAVYQLPKDAKARRALQKAHPEWASKTVRFTRGGHEEHYVVQQAVADWLRFDPNWVRHPNLYAASRIFQWNTTGAGAPWFAPARLLRDTGLVQITTPPEMRHLGLYVGDTHIPLPGAALIHSGKGVVEQWHAHTRKGLADMFYKAADSGSNKILNTLFSEQTQRDLAKSNAHAYETSISHIIAAGGGADTSYSHNAVKGYQSKLSKWVDTQAPGPLKAFGKAWVNTFDSIQNAPIHSVMAANIRRQIKKHGGISGEELDKIVAKTKGITGDVTSTGRSFVRDTRHPRGERPFGKSSETVSDIASGRGLTNLDYGKVFSHRGINATFQNARETSPWFNATIQGFRSLGKAYWRNPVRFTTRLWIGVGLPQLLAYYTAWTQGPEYLDHMMVNRSEYDRASKIYIAPFWLGGKGRPEDGYEFPFAPEIASVGYMFINALDHLARNGGSEMSTVMSTIGKNYFGLVTPPALSSVAALTTGYVLPSTLPNFGDSIYKAPVSREGVFPEVSKLISGDEFYGQRIELAIRALWGGSSGIYIGALNSLMEEGDVLAAIKEGAYQTKQRLPLIRETKLSAFTELSEKQHSILNKLDEMEKIYDIQIVGGGRTRSEKSAGELPGMASISGVPEKPPGLIEHGTLDLSARPFLDPYAAVQAKVWEVGDGKYAVLPTVKENMQGFLTKLGNFSDKQMENYYKASNAHYGVFNSEAAAQAYLTQLEKAEVDIKSDPQEDIGTEIPGAPEVTAPSNWIYVKFADDIHKRFETDGFGFKTKMKRLKQITTAVQSLRRLNEGKLGEWKKSIDTFPEGVVKDKLKKANPQSRADVQRLINDYERERVSTQKWVDALIDGAQNAMSLEVERLTGQKYKVDLMTLDPYEEAPIPEPPDLFGAAP